MINTTSKGKSDLRPSKIFLYVFSCIGVTILLVSSILFSNYKQNMLVKIFNSEKSSLMQASYSANQMTQSSKNYTLQLYYNTEISNILLFDSVDFLQLDKAFKSMNTYMNTSPSISSIYLYNHKMNRFYCSIKGRNSLSTHYIPEEFFDTDIYEILKNFSTYTRLYPITRIVPDIKNDGKGVYTFIYFENKTSMANLSNAIIVNVSEEWLGDIINQMTSTSIGSTFIVDKTGKLMTNTSDSKILTDISDKTYIKNILSSKKDSNYFVENVNGIKQLVIFTHYKPLDWFFVRIIPYSKLINDINRIQFFTVIAAIGILLAGAIISLLLSSRIYRPFNVISLKLKALESEKRSNSGALKEELLRNLITGNEKISTDDLVAKFSNLSIKLDLNDYYLFAYLRIDHYSDFVKENSPGDIKLLKFAISNIMQECLSQNFITESTDMLNDSIVIIINLTKDDADNDNIYNIIEELVKKSQQSVLDLLKISISLTISTVCHNVNEWKAMYDDSCYYSQYRLYYGRKSVIFYENLKYKAISGYKTPAKYEKTLIDALISRKPDDITEAYNSIISNAMSFSIETFLLALSHLALTIASSLENMETNGNYKFHFNYGEFITLLNKCETVDEINSHFMNLFNYIISKGNERKISKYSDLIEKVTYIVETQYMDQGHCIESIAKQLNMSHVYLGRLIKSLISKSIVDYINEVRIKKACEFLETTDLSISEVVEKSGYSNAQYFYKIFKKTFEVTPGDFRQKFYNTVS